MHEEFSRRLALKSWAAGFLATPPVSPPVNEAFPAQTAALVREMVSVSHGNVKRVRELVTAHPALAKASWDWGFGDWETALGAASHVGNREIAEFLIANGAPPTLFSATMLGHLDTVKAIIAADPGAQRIPGPHSISLLAHAKAGGPAARAVYDYLDSMGDAGAPPAVPLTEEEAAVLAGSYKFGAGATDRIQITVNRGQLSFEREGTVARGLVHLGERAFHPAGAAAVRIRFAPDDGGIVMTVHDPDLVLTARRS